MTKFEVCVTVDINPLDAELKPICHFLALLGAHHILHIRRIRVKWSPYETDYIILLAAGIALRTVTVAPHFALL